MSRDCIELQEALVEKAGNVDQLSVRDRDHLSTCEPCRLFATLERSLEELLHCAVPPDNPSLQEKILAAVAEFRMRRRWLAALPVAASLAFALLGVTILGGVPAGGLAASIPAWSGGGFLALVRTGGDLFTGLATAGGVAAGFVSVQWGLAAALSGAAGAAGFVAWSRRWAHRAVCSARS